MSDSSADKKEPWINQMALTTVIFAVCATLSTFKGGAYSTTSVINQAQASDQWSFYQAKSMKQHLFEIQVDQMKLQEMALDPRNPARQAFEDKIKQDQEQISRYAKEKKDIEAKARELESQRDEAKRHNRPFGLAVMLLQVTILLSSIAGLLKSKKIWWTALPIGLVGIFYFLDGFFVFL